MMRRKREERVVGTATAEMGLGLDMQKICEKA
jgi:hypothetical protein